MLNRSGNNRLPCLVSHLEGNAFHILTLTVASDVGFLYMPDTDSVMCPCGPSFLSGSNSSSSWRCYWQIALDCQPSSAKESQPAHITPTSWGSSPQVAGWQAHLSPQVKPTPKGYPHFSTLFRVGWSFLWVYTAAWLLPSLLISFTKINVLLWHT